MDRSDSQQPAATEQPAPINETIIREREQAVSCTYTERWMTEINAPGSKRGDAVIADKHEKPQYGERISLSA